MKSKPKQKVKSIAKILDLIAKDYGFSQMDWDRNRRQKWERVKSDPFKSLIGTILSARNRDESTSQAAEALFSRYDNAEKLAAAPVKSIERLIRKSGFYKTKARYIKATSKMIVDKFGGKVPESMDELCSFPGVGKKVAGCVMVYSFGKPEIPVDTHVARVSRRIGITKEKNPDKIRLDLMKKSQKKHWIVVNELFVSFGKRTCKPIGPLHEQCPVRQYCDFYKNLRGKSKRR